MSVGTAGSLEPKEAVTRALVVEKGLPGGRIDEGMVVGEMLEVEDWRSVDGEVMDRRDMASTDIDEVGR